MRATLVRLSVLVVGVATVLSCDGGPMVSKFGSGIAGGATGTSPIVPPAPGSIDSFRPFVRIDTPLAPPTPPALINVGDSILVVVRAIDDRKLGTLTITGYKYLGSASLGNLTIIQRYPQISAPGAAGFRAGLTDTVIRRYLKAATPVDTTVDSLVIEAVLQDSSGNADTTRRTIQLVTGPKVVITSPANGDSVPRGVAFTVTAQADHPTGVDTMWIRVVGQATWPTRLDTTIGVKFPPGTRIGNLSANISVPPNAPFRGQMTVSANAIDVNRNPGSATPIIVFVRAAANIPPRVYQTVPLKLEHTDGVVVTAFADGVRAVGRIVLDSVFGVINRDSVLFTSPFTANKTVTLPLNLGLDDQGRRISITSFAIDSSGVYGYSLPTGVSAPTTIAANAFRDTSLITFGRTFAFPRAGVAGDIAVDEVRGHVFVSNTNFNLLEVWDNNAKTFAASGVQVGSQPWGLFVARTGANADTLLVGNSGATTISKVDMAVSPPSEALAKRLRTRNSVNFEVQFAVDATSGKTIITWDGRINSYSDRPQYVAQSAGGRIFFSTKPTDAKTPGTLRWVDPALVSSDTRQIHQYGRRNTSETEKYVFFNLDSIAVQKGPSGTGISDTLVAYDHPYGTLLPGFEVRAARVPLLMAALALAGSDAEAQLGLSLASLSLTDTNFVAASGDRNWVAFGEGNAARIGGTLVDQGSPTARIMMVNDPGGPLPGFFSHAIQVDDIQENASEKVFGLALDTTGLQLLGHGDKSFVAAVDLPFHLRLDGIYDSFANGAGVAFHPRAKGTNTLSANDRIAFTATRTGVIEAFDVAHYNNRGRYVTKGDLYGPLRVTPPLPGDPPTVILKLYGLSAAGNGIIVIDLQAQDIKP